MKYSNEIKVGVTIVLATVIFVLGVRYFEALPLFRGTYDLNTEFENSAGLIAGNAVRINGVTVGSVDAVSINPENNRVSVRFHVDADVPVPEGSTTLVTGFDALGVVRMDVKLGPAGNPRVPEGGFVPSADAVDLIGDLSARAPELMDQVGTALESLEAVLGQTNELVSDPNSDVRRSLQSMRHAMNTVDALLRTQRDRITSVLENVDGASAQMDTLLSENRDSLKVTVQRLNATLARMDRTLVQVDAMSSELSELLRKINAGEGTLGRLANDPGLYERTDSLLIRLNRITEDFQRDPGRYLKEMRIVDLF